MKDNSFQSKHDGLTIKYRYNSTDDGNVAAIVIDSVFPDEEVSEAAIITSEETGFEYEGVKYHGIEDLCRACGYTRLKRIWHRSEQGSKYANPDFPWLKDTTMEEITEFLQWKKARSSYVLAGVFQC